MWPTPANLTELCKPTGIGGFVSGGGGGGEGRKTLILILPSFVAYRAVRSAAPGWGSGWKCALHTGTGCRKHTLLPLNNWMCVCVCVCVVAFMNHTWAGHVVYRVPGRGEDAERSLSTCLSWEYCWSKSSAAQLRQTRISLDFDSSGAVSSHQDVNLGTLFLRRSVEFYFLTFHTFAEYGQKPGCAVRGDISGRSRGKLHLPLYRRCHEYLAVYAKFNKTTSKLLTTGKASGGF